MLKNIKKILKKLKRILKKTPKPFPNLIRSN